MLLWVWNCIINPKILQKSQKAFSPSISYKTSINSTEWHAPKGKEIILERGLNGNLPLARFIICNDLENANYLKNISSSKARRQEALLGWSKGSTLGKVAMVHYREVSQHLDIFCLNNQNSKWLNKA